MRLLLFSVLIGLSINLFSQGQNNLWYFGGDAGLDFSSGTPIADTNSVMHASEGSITVCDSAGNLLFYSNGENVYDQTHSIMLNGWGLLGDYSTTQCAVAKLPGSDSIYYFFHPEEAGYLDGLRYSEINMNLNGGLGGVTANKNVLLTTPVCEKVTIIKHQNNIDYWVITYLFGTNRFHSYLLTASGIDTIPVMSDVGTVVSSNVQTAGPIKVSPDGSRIALTHYLALGMELFDFDRITGRVSNQLDLSSFLSSSFINPYGVEFSPNGNLLYISTSSSLYQLNLLAGSDTAIFNSMINISHSASYYLQLGPDNKIYNSNHSSTSISVINDPNNIGLSCNFVSGNISLSGRQCYAGLPPLNDFYNVFTYSNLCLGDSTAFELSVSIADSVLWDFGDTLSAGNNNSTILTPKHLYTNVGNYIVSLLIYNGGVTDTIVKTLHISPIPVFNLGTDTSLCAGDVLTLTSSPSNGNFLWQDNSENQSYTVLDTGLYWVENTLNGCYFSDTISINYNQLPNVTILSFSPDTVCDNEGLIVLPTGLPSGGSYSGNGITGIYFDPNTAGLGMHDIIYTYTDSNSCSNNDTTSLTVNATFSFTNNDTICQSDSILLGGLYQTLSGTYYDTLQSVNSCDSIITTTLLVNPIFNFSQNDAICQGDSILLGGLYQKISGTYYDTLQAVTSCDSIISTTLVVNSTFAISHNDTICQGDSILLEGSYQTLNGTYYDTLQTVNGCDSILSTDLTINSTYIFNENQSICSGDSLFIYGLYQNTAGIYYDSLQTINGCDSVLSTTLALNSIYAINQSNSICQGDSILIYNNYQNTTGIYYDSLLTINGCDSILSTTLTVTPIHNLNVNSSICQGDSIFLGDSFQTAAGIFIDSLQTLNGCDSIITTTLTINPIPNVNISLFNPDTLCFNASSVILPTGTPSGGNYTGAGVAGINFDPAIAGIGIHNIIYTYTDTNSCVNRDTTIITIDACTGINNSTSDFGILIYPNPSTGLFTIEKPNNLNKEVQIRVLDATSKLIVENTISLGKQKIEVDITTYSSGIYYLQLQVEEEVFVKQILKK